MVWGYWHAVNGSGRDPLIQVAPPPSPEALAEAERRQRVQQLALDRAEALLLDHLSSEQAASWLRDRFFDVIGGLTRTRYRLNRGLVANIDVLDGEQRRRYRLCGLPAGQLPVPDVLLAQKFSLEHNEQHFLQLARVH